MFICLVNPDFDVILLRESKYRRHSASVEMAPLVAKTKREKTLKLFVHKSGREMAQKSKSVRGVTKKPTPRRGTTSQNGAKHIVSRFRKNDFASGINASSRLDLESCLFRPLILNSPDEPAFYSPRRRRPRQSKTTTKSKSSQKRHLYRFLNVHCAKRQKVERRGGHSESCSDRKRRTLCFSTIKYPAKNVLLLELAFSDKTPRAQEVIIRPKVFDVLSESDWLQARFNMKN